MTSVGMSVGGQGGQRQREPMGARTAVDWSDAKYATPQPPPKVTLGKRSAPELDTPSLPERTIRVRTRPPAIFYTLDGLPIPSDEFMTVPVSSGIIEAIKAGDLERGPDQPDDHHAQGQKSRHGRHFIDAAKPDSGHKPDSAA